MSRLSYALLVVSGLSFLSGCQSERFARLSRDSTSASTIPDAAVDLDPRVARLQKKNWFDKSDLPKEYAAAKEELNDASGLYQALAEYHAHAAVTQKNPALLEKARQSYTTLLQDDPESLKAMLGLADVDLKADRIADAERMYRTVLAKFPQNSEALAAVAAFYNETDRSQEVLRMLPEAIRRDPEDRALRNQMGLALVQSGQPEAAVPHFTKVEGQASAYATIANLLADSDPVAARNYVRRALDRNPELEKAKAVMAKLQAPSNDIQQVSGRRASRSARRIQRAANALRRQ